MTPTNAYILVDAYHAEPICVCYSMESALYAIQVFGKQWSMSDAEIQHEIELVRDNPFGEDTTFKIEVVPFF